MFRKIPRMFRIPSSRMNFTTLQCTTGVSTQRNSNPIMAVYFDMCGTLVDDKSIAPVEAFSETFRTVGVDLKSNEIRQFMGISKYDHIKSLVHLPRVSSQLNIVRKELGVTHDDELYPLLYQKYLHFQAESARKWCHPISGVPLVLCKLQEQGIFVGTTSGFPQRICNIVIENLHKDGIFCFSVRNVLGSDSVPNGARPNPGLINELMLRQYITNPRSVIKVGDTVADIKEGKNAGVWTVAVTETSSDLEVTRQEYNRLNAIQKKEANEYLSNKFYYEGADYVIRDISELPEIIKGINSQ